MAEEEQAERLYDFLYRDNARFSSYYAQIFGGKLSTIERTNSERRQKDSTGKVSVSLIGGERRSSVDSQETLKEIIDPHDLVAIDVLSRLVESSRLKDDLSASSPGSMLILHGSIVFVDRIMTEMARLVFDSLVDAEEKKPKNKRDQGMILSVGSMSKLLGKLTIPSTFCFRTGRGEEAVGIIHENGMSEPISSYYFRHGAEGIPDVFLIGIKETKTTSIQFPETEFTSAARSTADALSKMLFPEAAIRVTPIAVFRKL